MCINRYDFEGEHGEGCWARLGTEGDYVSYEDHIKVVDSYLAEIAAAKAEIDKLMLSLESWDEEFK